VHTYGGEMMVATEPAKDNICAVIVTYQPDDDFEMRARRIADLVDQVIVVDNHSNFATVKRLRRLNLKSQSKLLLNNHNLGVATALNQGVKMALDLGYKWTLLFDQDSNPHETMVQILAAVFRTFPEKNKLALIGSNYHDANSGLVLYPSKTSNSSDWIEQKTVITSGSLLQLQLFKTIGRFRDEFFIDHVDHEYCLQARARGYRIISTSQPLMTHSLGEAATHRLLWRSVVISNHSALRHYYMMRNHIVMAKEYIFKEPGWVISTLYWRLIANILIIPFEKDKATKIKLCFLGFFDGLTSNFIRILDKAN